MGTDTSGKRANQKLKPYIVLQILQRETDENHVLSAVEIAAVKITRHNFTLPLMLTLILVRIYEPLVGIKPFGDRSECLYYEFSSFSDRISAVRVLFDRTGYNLFIEALFERSVIFNIFRSEYLTD